MHFLGFVGYGIWPLSLVSLALLFEALEAAGGAWRAFRLGALFGWIAYLGGYLWLWRIVDAFLSGNVWLGGALWLAYSLWFAGRFALFALGYRFLRGRGAPVALAALLPLLAIEGLYPDLFPVHVGVALIDQIAWIQVADLGGPLALSALVVLANAALFETWRYARDRRPRPVLVWVLTPALALGVWGYGRQRIREVEREMAAAPALRLGIVQGNLSTLSKRSDPEAVARAYLAQTRELLAAGDVDLVIWPETVVARGLQRPLPLSGRYVRGELQVPILFGAATTEVQGGRRETWNSALLLGADGTIRAAYDKNLLIPFAEYVPFDARAPELLELFPSGRHFAASRETPALALGPWRISTPICYEAVRPDFVRRMVAAARPHLLVSLANDAWFGDSQEPRLHDAMARLRAVEHRRYFVRATNSGISSVVDPLGRVVARTQLLARENLVAEVRLLDGATLYGRSFSFSGDASGSRSGALRSIGSTPGTGMSSLERSSSPRYLRLSSP
ncbi:MAG TPA: apolipoprotein N-acyltransferase [Myxococcota bacterium]|nr:apolipoprotein N-acyltransferase [Myxococcota bacterium]